MIEFGNDRLLLDCNPPFILEINDSENNRLHIVLALSCKGEKGADTDFFQNPNLNKLLKEVTPVFPDENNVYEIIFEEYILYQTRNESYCFLDNYDIRNGQYLILFERSRLLDYFQTVTDCCKFSDGSFYPDEWKHYGIYTANHIIDIISHKKPLIRKTNGRSF